MSSLNSEWSTIREMPHIRLHTTVIRSAVDRYCATASLSSLNSDRYLVTPLPMHPLEKLSSIEEKLDNCPTKATPDGPIMAATTLTLTSPVHILTRVEMEVSPNTRTMSMWQTRFMRLLILNNVGLTGGRPLVDEADYLGDFGVGHDGGDGEGEFLGVDLFGDGEGEVVELWVAFLTVGWDGVVDDCLDAVVGEVLLELVAVGGEDGEDVEDVGVGVG